MEYQEPKMEITWLNVEKQEAVELMSVETEQIHGNRNM